MPAPAATPETPVWGAPYGAALAVAEVPATDAAGELHPVSLRKFVLLSFCTFGLYDAYWFYRNWKRVRERTGRRLSPFWRAVFAPLWSFSLFDEVSGQARAAQVPVRWSAMPLALAFFVLSALWRVPPPWSLLCFFSFLPLVPVQQTINEMAAQRGVRPDDTFDGRHIAVVALGSMLVILAVIGTLLPPQ